MEGDRYTIQTLFPVYKLLSAFVTIPLTGELENDDRDDWDMRAYVSFHLTLLLPSTSEEYNRC